MAAMRAEGQAERRRPARRPLNAQLREHGMVQLLARPEIVARGAEVQAGAERRSIAARMPTAHLLALQASAGNAAVAGLLRPASRRDSGPPTAGPAARAQGGHDPAVAADSGTSVASATPVVARCGADNPDCGCSDEDKLEAAEQAPVQRDPLGPGSSGGPFGFPGDQARDRLNFTNRMFLDQALPTECPRCHREAPTMPMPPRYIDREATEPRLVTWAEESESALHTDWTARRLQLKPGDLGAIVDDYGAGLAKRITDSHEFEGSQGLREAGASIVRRRWPDIQPVVTEKARTYYQGQLMTALGMTPKASTLIINPTRLAAVLAVGGTGTVELGRWNATAKAGDRLGNFMVFGADSTTVYLTLVDRPAWIYEIGAYTFVRTHDPFVGEVIRQVYDNTKWIQQVMPFLLKVGAFGLGFSGSIALIITSIALDELATEMQADADGRPGRSPLEILGSAGIQLLVDRLFHGLLGGSGAGRAATATAEAAVKAERIADRAVPLVRKELAQSERPLVKQALEQGTGRKVADKALQKEGYVLEVAVDAAGDSHLYRLNKNGTWCRFSTPVCGLDLGSDVAAAAGAPKSITQSRIDDARHLITTAESEITFLSGMYSRMKAAGKMDLSLLKPEERTLLDSLAPSGDAAKLTLAELRGLSAKLGLAKDVRAAAALEEKLIEQLYREGRPLYEIMRIASPSGAARSAALREAAARDTVTGLRPRSGMLDVDHVVSLNEIVAMKGFAELHPSRQLMIVNDAKNLRAMDRLANRSRGDRSWSEWAQAAIHYDGAALRKMRQLEDDLRGYLQGRIAALRGG